MTATSYPRALRPLEPRRRPSGGPTPLERPIFRSGRLYLAITALMIVAWVLAMEIPAASRSFARLDEEVVSWIARRRSDALAEELVDVIAAVSAWLWRLIRWATIAVLLVSRRLRHLVVHAAIVLGVTAAMHIVIDIAERPAPAQAHPAAAALAAEHTHPSRAVIELGVSVVGALYTLVPRGRERNRAKLVAGLLIGAFVLGRLYMGVEHPTDLVAALVLGTAVPVVLFRYLTPHHVYPVRYGRRHGGELSAELLAGIAEGVADQLGWVVERIDALRPPGSAGSTPLRIALRHDDREPASLVFGKLYSLAHLRSDRWYKLVRAALYGRLEDEAPFADIRHLVEHEDYMLRVARSAGIPAPNTFGIVEVSRGREYLLLLEWIDDGEQLNASCVTDDVISQGFGIVEGLWRAGIAHRDIKPANLMVAGGRLHLVDFSFAEVRPSPWRQAVDLGTMALSLGAYSSPEAVLRSAGHRFTPEEMAEALAASHSVTIPAQLRAVLRDRAPQLHRQLAAALPAFAPIAVQRWSASRLLLTAALVAACTTTLLLVAFNVTKAGLL